MKKLLFISLLPLVAGCSSLRITNSWKENNLAGKKYEKILVLALIGEPDRTLREKMEQHLAGDLKDLGYNAVTSIEEYGPKAFEGMKEADVVNMFADRSVDAIVTIVLLDKEKERYYVPAHVHRSPYVIYQNRFWNYYSTMYDRVYTPGYYETNTKYFWETNFYDLGESRLLYSAQSQSFDPESVNNLAHQYGQMLINDMAKSNVIQKQERTLKSF